MLNERIYNAIANEGPRTNNARALADEVAEFESENAELKKFLKYARDDKAIRLNEIEVFEAKIVELRKQLESYNKYANDGQAFEGPQYWQDRIDSQDRHIRKLEAVVERGPKVKIVDGDVWLSFGDQALVSVEALIGGRGPIVQKNVRKWRDNVLADLEDGNE